MSTLPTTTLSEPTGSDKIASWMLTYFRARLKQRVYSLLLNELKRKGISQAILARRLGKEPAQVSRIFSGPGNLTLETVSDLLFAISGSEPGLSIEYPLAKSVTRSVGAAGEQGKGPAAAALRRKGGAARAKSVTAGQRATIARKAAKKRRSRD